MTVVIRAAMLPLTFKQFHSMQRLQAHMPELKAIQAKYKDDKQRQQQEVMKFYKENNVNPLGSCLPLAAQLPVFISLFYMLRKDLRHDICPDINPPTVTNPKPCGSTEASQFFFIPDITNTAHGAVLVTLVVLYVGSQLLSSVFMTTTTDRNQRLLMMALPFVFVAFVINFPAGLLVYWITTNLWTVGQGLVVRKLAPPVVAPAGAAAGVALATGARAATPDRKRRPQDRDENGGSREKAPSAEKAAPEKAAPRAAAPPPPPRKKKKRSGRRR
jgi:YidC/Oxa1 family membrane protein insertase